MQDATHHTREEIRFGNDSLGSNIEIYCDERDHNNFKIVIYIW